MRKFLRPYVPAMLLVGMLVGCGSATEDKPKAPEPSEAEQTPTETTSQRDARRKAEEYIAESAHSRTSLIKELESEEFSNEDATYAVDALGFDWRDQAARKAKEYLDDSSYSRDGLKDQLQVDGFTEEQAEYGVSQFYDTAEVP